MTSTGTTMTPTKGGAENEAGKVQMPIKQLANDQERVQRMTSTNLMNKNPKQIKILESEKSKIQADSEAGKGLQKKWNSSTRLPKNYFRARDGQCRDTHENTAKKHVEQKIKILESEKSKIQADSEAGKGLQKKWNSSTRLPKNYFRAWDGQCRDTHENTAKKHVEQKIKILESEKSKLQADSEAGKGLQKKWNSSTRLPKNYFRAWDGQCRDTHENTAKKHVEQKKKRLESEKHKIQAGIEAGKGFHKERNDFTSKLKYFKDLDEQSRDTHE